MTDAKTPESMSPKLRKVAERAERNPEQRILALARLIDVPALERAYRRLRKDAAVGVDEATVEQNGQDLQGNLEDLHVRRRAGRYRRQSIRRVHIPKESGKTRPVGLPTVEDKCVQGALREVLEAVYEQDFLECSYGFRPGRSPHDALRALYGRMRRGGCWVLEADIVSFFDSIDRKLLMEMVRKRIADESLMRLVGKCLQVGVLDGGQYSEPDVGTAQGSAISPLLGNIHLHYVLDLWFERIVKPRLCAPANLVRFADDFVICFDDERDARRVEAVLDKRMAKFGLTLHPEKTRLLGFRPPPGGRGKGSATFDILPHMAMGVGAPQPACANVMGAVPRHPGGVPAPAAPSGC